MGLFDLGGFDLSALGDMFNPMGMAQAAESGGGFDEAMREKMRQGLMNSPIAQAMRDKMGAGAPPPDAAVVPPAGGEGVPLPMPRPQSAPQFTEAPPGAMDNWRAEADAGMGRGIGAPGGLGAALTGNRAEPPAPSAPPPTATAAAAPPATPEPASAPTDVSAQKRGETKRPTLAEALKGVTMPPKPELQRIASPSAPRPTTQIKSGDLQALLLALNAGAPLINKIPTLGGRG